MELQAKVQENRKLNIKLKSKAYLDSYKDTQ